jgi:hypothetical protein
MSEFEALLTKVAEGLVGMTEAEIEEAMAAVGKHAEKELTRFDEARAPESTDAAWLNSTLALLGTEASARLTILARTKDLASPQARSLVHGVGGALDAAVGCIGKRDLEGAQRFLAAAVDLLDL